MKHETYNGWANYPTWIVGLWFDIDDDAYVQTREMVSKIKNCYGKEELTTLETIAFHLKHKVENWTRAIFKSDNMIGYGFQLGDFYTHGAIVDLYGYMNESDNDNPTKAEIVETVKRGLEIVNWQEIAQLWLED